MLDAAGHLPRKMASDAMPGASRLDFREAAHGRRKRFISRGRRSLLITLVGCWIQKMARGASDTVKGEGVGPVKGREGVGPEYW